MGLSFNPTDLFRLLIDGRKDRRARVSAYLDGVAADARELADIWTEAWRVGKAGGGEVARDLVPRLFRLDPNMNPADERRNIRPFSRLTEFYKGLSSVLGSKGDPEFHQRFNHHLAVLLQTRNLSAEAFSSLPWDTPRRSSEQASSFVWASSDNGGAAPRSVSELIEMLNREAAALEVLAKQFKATS